MAGSTSWTRGLKWASEAIVLMMVCLLPWAIGGVDSWAGLALAACVMVLAVLHTITSWSQDWSRRLLCIPSLAILGLGVLGAVQFIPMSEARLKSLAPVTHQMRAKLTSATPQRVLGDSRVGVGLPASTLSLEPDATAHVVALLAGTWVLFQAALGLGSLAALRRLGAAMMINATFLAIFALAQALAWNGKIYGIRLTPPRSGWSTGGPFVCHNHLAASLSLGLGFAAAFLLMASRKDRDLGQRKTRFRKTRRDLGAQFRDFARLWTGDFYLGPAYAVGVILVGILGSHSRGGFLAMILSGVAVGAILRPKNLYFKGILALFALVPLLLITLGTASPFYRLLTILDPSSTGYTLRFELWRHVLEAWRHHPILGTGLGSFIAAVTPDLDFRIDALYYFSHAENEYLQLLVEGGLVGLSIGLVAIAGIGRLIRRAYKATSLPNDRTLLMGGAFGCFVLAFQSFSDFPLHIPGITVPAVILIAYLCRLGLDSNGQGQVPARSASWSALAASALGGVAMITLSACVVAHEFKLARAEILVVQAGLPFPASMMPSAGIEQLPRAELERRQEALVTALRARPNWWEGHYHLGMTYLGLFEVTASEWLKEAEAPPEGEGSSTGQRASGEESSIGQRASGEESSTGQRTASSSNSSSQNGENGQAAESMSARMATPNWLHLVVHSTPPEKQTEAGGILEQEPVRDYLLPAAREFLEARRCCPSLAPPHLRLATLDYLLDGGEPTSVHATRALQLAGANSPVIDLAAQLAAQAGDIKLAARCWKQSLAVCVINHKGGWEAVADAAGLVLSPEQILNEVLPPGGLYALRFADRIYGAPESHEARMKLLNAALERLPQDTDLPKADKIWLEAQIKARLDDRVSARQGMESALRQEPLRSEWRREFTEWLLNWGDLEEAHRQALVGDKLAPNDYRMREILKLAVDMLSRGPDATKVEEQSPETTSRTNPLQQ